MEGGNKNQEHLGDEKSIARGKGNKKRTTSGKKPAEYPMGESSL